ncbi:DUF3549 family protein [Pseudoalteromonas sp. T1lg10]|uniref:DUF3549 family protein n=1 Tax=Pseudoalteromonas sp. T1lg10 TaxID=2077093 RepID=UPI000CF6FDAE|nr:DUF3549 family protein [Pseudoalteromonas sp. T1lg10]
MTANIATLAELLDAAGTTWRVYDIGRRVQKLDKATFADIESTKQAYPFPLAQHALLAIQFWDAKASAEPYVWFLKLPLDEQSKLVAASRDHFANMVLEAVGTQLLGDEKEQSKLDNNPYVFTPNANKRAAFNAHIKVELRQSASQYYEHTQLYFSGKLGWQQWQSIAVQGLADFAARLNQGDNEQRLCSAWEHLPAEVRQPLAAQLENAQVSTQVAEMLQQSIQHALGKNDKALLIDSLRAISFAPASGICCAAIDEVLASNWAEDADICQVIAGRLWTHLQAPERLAAFMEKSAQIKSEQPVFASLFADLVAIPTLRPHVLAMLRCEQRSEALSRAIGGLFS